MTIGFRVQWTCPWGADRGLDGLDVDGGEHRVERRGELSIAVTDEEAEATTGIFETSREVAGDLGDPGIVRVGGDAEEVDNSSLDLDHEQDLVATQKHGVDREEVRRQRALALGAEELYPGRAVPAWRWRDPVAPEDVGDASLRDRDAEPL